MIIFLIFIFLIYSLEPSYRIVTDNNVIFTRTFTASYPVGPCNDTSYNPSSPPDLSCNLIIDYGKIPEINPSIRYTKTESATCSWRRTRTTYYDPSCNGSRVYIYDKCDIRKDVYLDKVGEFNASLICNAGYSSYSGNNLLDLEDPTIQIHITPSSPSPDQNYTLRFNVSDDNPNISCSLSINNIVIRNYNFTTNSSVEINLTLPWGITQVRIYCQDKTRLTSFIGMKRSSQQTRIINRYTSQTVDINILSPDNYFSTNNLTKKPVDINFTVNNSPTHNGTCMIYVEDQIFTINYTNNSFYHIRINDPNKYLEGKYTWNISCIDSGPKNRRTTPSRVFYIDYTPPNITLLNPGNNSNISINPYNFQYRVVDQAAQDLTHKTTCINKVNSNQINQDILENQYDQVQQFSSSLIEGQNRWEITCTDLAGNNITLWHNFIYRDGNPPIITPKSPLYSSPPSVTTTFHISETNSFTCTVQLRNEINGSTISRSVSGLGTGDISVSFGNFPSGSYSWKVTCSDNNGNSNTAGPIYFTIYTSSSSPTITCTNSSINIRDLFFPFAVLGLILILIGYYGGTILNNQDIVTGAKMEFKSFIITVLIFVLITYAANSFYCDNVFKMFSNTHTTILNLSKEANKSLTISSEIYAKSAILSSVSGIEYSLDFVGFGGVRLKFNLAKKLFEFTENLVGVYNLIFDRIAGLFIANNLIQFISLYSYNFLLYIALIARVFPPTKRIGTTLLAISVTFIFIAPLVYNLSLNLYVNLFTGALRNLENHLQDMNKDVDSIYQPVKQSLERLVDIANLSKQLELFWMGIKFVGFLLLQVCKFIGICYPFAYIFFVPVLNYVVYPGINAILNILWISQTVNVQIQYAGGGYSIIDSMYDSYEAASFSLAFINVLSLFFYLFNIIVIIVTIRAISLLGAGDYFLYGIEERI